jgi:hypothetical protein
MADAAANPDAIEQLRLAGLPSWRMLNGLHVTPQPASRCNVANFSQVETCVALDDRRHRRVMPPEDAEIKDPPQPRGLAEPIAGGIRRSNNAAGSIQTNGRK